MAIFGAGKGNTYSYYYYVRVGQILKVRSHLHHIVMVGRTLCIRGQYDTFDEPDVLYLTQIHLCGLDRHLFVLTAARTASAGSSFVHVPAAERDSS